MLAKRWLTAATAAVAALLLSLGIWAYLRSTQYDDSLHQYMADYFHKRESQEKIHRTPARVSFEKSSDNPFVQMPEQESSDNPFRERRR